LSTGDRQAATSVVSGPLTSAQIEQFVVAGYCVLRAAFTPAQAAAARAEVWRRMEEKAAIREDDPATWPEAYDIEEHLTHPAVLECFTDRLAAAVEQLTGPGRWRGERRWGFWPVNFSYLADRPYDVPDFGWHVDGNWFRHTLDCPNQGLLVIGLFSDVEPGWGGTVLSLGSHRQTARVLAAHPAGLHHRTLFSKVLAEPLGNFWEATGCAGDVVLAHPFMFHARGIKQGGPPRMISNTEAGLRHPLRVSPRDRDVAAPVELAIHRALAEPPLNQVNPRRCRFLESD
jgi:hypothetical protein